MGGYAVQLAKHYGLYVVADAASADEELVKELGADLIVARGDQVAARIRDALPTGVDGVIDAALYNAIAAAGRDGGSITRDAST
ncbi:hypothetical protein A5724_19205 [Mycobacterium sp. ACS1612]|nr:hypothetical protein A5724_19205 [Mycobacterium sp. ACS1612]